MRFYLQKIAFYVVALWAAVTLNFLIPRLMPGNPVDIMIAKMGAAGQPITAGTRRGPSPRSSSAATVRRSARL